MKGGAVLSHRPEPLSPETCGLGWRQREPLEFQASSETHDFWVFENAFGLPPKADVNALPQCLLTHKNTTSAANTQS